MTEKTETRETKGKESPQKQGASGDNKSKKENPKGIEREYVIPLRKKLEAVPRYKKANKAVKTIKEFLVRHMKIRDGDLGKVKIDKYLNEFVWSRGIRKPPVKVRVKAVKESGSDTVVAELAELPEKLKFKRLREEKREKLASEVAEKKKAAAKEAEEKRIKEEAKEEKKEEEEKKASVVEEGKQLEKEAHKKAKHQVQEKAKKPKHEFRKALKK